MAEDPPVTPRRQHGHSRAYILDRLKRENRTDLAAGVEAGTVSAFAAAVQCGWTKRPPSAATVTHQARKRRLGFQAIEGGLSAGQMMELWLGPNPSQGSLFGSREELVQAWEQNRDEVMRQWGSRGRRPAGYYEFEWDGPRPPYATERSSLWRAGVFSEAECAELEAEWKREFATAQAPDFTLNNGDAELLRGDCARLAYYRHHDIPRELVRRWEKAARRRRSRMVREKALDVASSAEGREEHDSGVSVAQPADH
jgi:hypothetical protein